MTMKHPALSRRGILRITGTALGGICTTRPSWSAPNVTDTVGVVVGEASAEKAGMQVLADGGNAIDAIVCAALVAAIAAPSMTGIGGYGMSATIATDGGKRVVAIDGNTTAPNAMPPDLFQNGNDGRPPADFNATDSLSSVGWLSAGVPGILAGLQLAIDQFGTLRFSDLAQPAIAIARTGFMWTRGLAAAVEGNEILQRDPGSRKLFAPAGLPLRVGETFRNPELAEMLAALAKADSVEAFYRGDIAHCIADQFGKHGGLVTIQDMASHKARLVEPLTMTWGEYRIHTAPLTAGGLSVLQMLCALHVLGWDRMPPGLLKTHTRIEAMRLAWRDRLTLLGDPEFSSVPIARLISEDYARESADRIKAVVSNGKLLTHTITRRSHTGTIHLSAADKHGNFAALTLTHGNAFGACVTVDGLGLTLGHGMSRFDPNPGHPNAPGPGKRPLHNMVPTVVTRNGQPVLAIGGTGGRKIPNGLFEVLTRYVVLGQTLGASIAAPRIHTEGDVALSFEKAWPTEEITGLRKLGYSVTMSGSASMNAVAMENGSYQHERR